MEELIEVDDLSRFQSDLEFLQCLTNAFYVEFLIRQNLFSDKKFLNYLEYLDYFKNPDYLRYVRYPISLKILEKIKNKKFIEYWKQNMGHFTNNVSDQIFAHFIKLSKEVEKPGKMEEENTAN